MTEQTRAAIEATRLSRKPTPRSGRCVHCSRPLAAHAEDGACPGGRTRYGTMASAEGVTCADCKHTERCCVIFGQLPEDESCHFFPVRFWARVPVTATR